jgi:hypothetical protein
MEHLNHTEAIGRFDWKFVDDGLYALVVTAGVVGETGSVL